MAVASVNCLLLPFKSTSLSVAGSSSCSDSIRFRSFSFFSNLSLTSFSNEGSSMRLGRRSLNQSVVCEAAPTKKADSAAQRARQAEKRRILNKSRKSEVRTQMKKVLEALEELKKKSDARAEEVLPIEKLIAEAYSAIDKAEKVGTLHRNTGARRKSRLARRKKDIEIHNGWYAPTPVINA